MLSEHVDKEELRALMRRYELTGYQVAKILKLKPQTIYAAMCGARRFRKRQLELVEQAVSRKWGGPWQRNTARRTG